MPSAGGNRVRVIAKVVQADKDTVRDVIHRSNQIGLACLDPNLLIAASVGLLEVDRAARQRDRHAFLDPAP